MGPYFGAFLGLGVALSFFGPALPTLREQTGSTLGQIGLVFGAQSLGGLAGSLVAGRLYRRFGGPHLIALAVVALAAGLAGVPLAGSLGAVIGLGGLIGLGAGTLDVSANTLTPTLVPTERLVSSMNALHMCFAIGALATPVLVFASTESSGGLGPACAVFAAALGALGLFVWRRDRADGARRAAADHEAAGAPPRRGASASSRRSSSSTWASRSASRAGSPHTRTRSASAAGGRPHSPQRSGPGSSRAGSR